MCGMIQAVPGEWRHAAAQIIKAMIRQTENSVFMETVIYVIEFRARAAAAPKHILFGIRRCSMPLTMKKCSMSPPSN